MKKITINSGTALLCALLLSLPQTVLADDDSFLADPGFELELAPDQGGWNLFDESRFSSKVSRSGDQSLFHWAYSRTVLSPPYLTGSVAGSYQEFTADPGSRWRLTGYGMTAATLEGNPAFGIVQLSFFDSLGNDLGTVETAESKNPQAKTSNKIDNRTAAGEWVFLDTGIVTAPAGSATVQAFTLYVDYSGSNTSQGVYFDDLSLCALEEGSESNCK